MPSKISDLLKELPIVTSKIAKTVVNSLKQIRKIANLLKGLSIVTSKFQNSAKRVVNSHKQI